MMGWYFLSQHKRKMFTHYKRTAVKNTHPQQQSNILINLVTDDDLFNCTGPPNPPRVIWNAFKISSTQLYNALIKISPECFNIFNVGVFTKRHSIYSVFIILVEIFLWYQFIIKIWWGITGVFIGENFMLIQSFIICKTKEMGWCI